MKRFGLMASMIVTGFVIQTSLLGFFNIFGAIPNIPLMLVVIFSMMSDGVTGGILGIMTGVLYDTMIYDVFGIHTVIFFVIGALIGNYSEYMLRENSASYAVVTAISTAVMHFLTYLILFFLRYKVGNAGGILYGIVIEILLNTVLVVFLLKVVIRVFNKLNVK
ncbi:MAG TPA: rod shape-determining protein MreD [Clostridiales bacterium]|nr:rod shape-determining protein MreD [Clostridiales bacterium]